MNGNIIKNSLYWKDKFKLVIIEINMKINHIDINMINLITKNIKKINSYKIINENEYEFDIDNN